MINDITSGSKRRFGVIFICFALAFCNTYAQKPVIDTAAINHWPLLNNDIKITADGQFVAYTVSHQYDGYQVMIFQSTKGSWKKTIPNLNEAAFTPEGKRAYYMTKDTLCFLTLGTDKVEKMSEVMSYKKPNSASPKQIAILHKDHNLVLYNLAAATTAQEFKDVSDYQFDHDGNHLLLKTSEGLMLIDLAGHTQTLVYQQKDAAISGYSMDRDGRQVVFLLKEKEHNSIGCYQSASGQTKTIATDASPGIDKLFIAGIAPKFSDDGNYVYFTLQEKDILPVIKDAPQVDVWNYKDERLQSLQQLEPDKRRYLADIDLTTGRINRLEHDFETVKVFPEKGDFIVLNHKDQGDRFWKGLLGTNYLLSLKDGNRTVLPDSHFSNFNFSPGGRFLIYLNPNRGYQYYSYDLSTGRSVIISKGSNSVFNNCEAQIKSSGGYGERITAVGIAGWLANDSGVLVYDNNDIWQLDLSGKKKPVKLTRGNRSKRKIIFRITKATDPFNFYRLPVFKIGDSVLLTAFDSHTKYNGFYQLTISNTGKVSPLVFGPWAFSQQGKSLGGIGDFDFGMRPIKAYGSNTWIISRQSSEQALNYFLTADFKSFQQLTNYQPQRNYNWIKSQLVSWKQLDGSVIQGVLYKPENFDPKKKYPVIITYYEQLSGRVFEYPNPDYYYDAHISIPWFVSHGYLVLTPDIYYQIGHIGKSVCNSVVGAGKWLRSLPYVDRKSIGIAGHSFGGFETNYLVTHSHIFSAAFEGAGVSDDISSAYQLGGAKIQGASRLEFYENVIGGSLWTKFDRYVENSPVLKANTVTTPLLIFHCKNDPAVPWAQAIEMFVALRRLDKPVWMLQYDGGEHSVSDLNDGKDLTFRVTQFFDHYLKGAPAPKWMTQGIPARLKGKALGYELDPTGKP